MNPSQEWFKKWQTKKDVLVPFCDLNEYFTLKEIAGKKLDLLDMGQASFPTGDVIVRDPLCYLTKRERPYLQKIPAGTYSVTACVVQPDADDCARYAAVKLTVTNNQAIRFEEALTGDENLDDCGPDSFFGFNVDAGLASIMDAQSRDAFCDFFSEWFKKNPDGNNYDDYFAALFAESYRDKPKYQRNGGDWINWTIPGTNLQIPIFQSGFGDGSYPVYFGYDKDEQVCCVIIQFIDIELAYSEDEGDDE